MTQTQMEGFFGCEFRRRNEKLRWTRLMRRELSTRSKCFKMNDSDDSFKKAFILRFVQFLGLKPYKLGTEESPARRSVPLFVYNVAVAVLVFLNAYVTSKDNKNDINYNNVAVLIGVAFAAVDFFGNLYICYAMVRTPVEIATSVSAWMRFRSIDRILSPRILFDYKRMRTYTCVKIFVVFLLVLAFTVMEIICCVRLNMHLTVGYHVRSLLPLIYSLFVALLFGCVSLTLFQRYWAVNNVLKEMADQLPAGFNPRISTSRNWMTSGFAPKEGLHRPKQPPVYVMAKYREDVEEESLLTKIRMLRETHFELYELIHEFNSSFGFHFLFQFIFFFFGCSINIYYVIIFHLRPYEIEQYVSACFWSLFLLFLASYIVFHTNLITNEAYRTTELVHLFLTRSELFDDRIQQELNSFSSQLMQCPVQIRAAGFFEVNSPLLFQFLTGVLSSVVFVVQFDKVNFGR